jgi:anthranilate synthase component I
MIISQFPEKESFVRYAETYNVIPVFMEILADTETPVSLLQKFLRDDAPVFLFESVEGGERWGRYSFLGTSARRHLRVFSDRVDIAGDGYAETIPHHGAPLTILREQMNRFRPAPISGLPRFWGGLVGYLNYEMVSFFEKIPSDWPGDKPIAHFIVPDAILVFDNVSHTLQVVVIAFLEEGTDPGRLFDSTRERIRDMIGTIESPRPGVEKTSPGPASHLTPLPEAGEFRSRVERIKAYIRAGDVIQTVISQPFTCEAPKDLWSLYRAQRYINPSPYLFFLRFDRMTLVGSSPETMIRLENGQATLRPIAGTRPRGDSEQADRALANELLNDEKERAEHLMLVDLGRNDLGRVAEIGTVQVTDLMIVERYSHVMHLVSNINCHLADDVDAWDLLAATFPAGTLSGAPKVRSMETIAELEKGPRGPYGGAVGYVSFDGNMDMAITIRTACVEGDRLTVRAGAGIVADSDPERERIETVNKAMAIDRALNLMERTDHDRDDR